MPEESSTGTAPKTLIYGGVAVVVAVGLLVAYLTGAFERRGDISADDVCSNLTDRKAAARTLNSALPEAADYDFTTGMSGDPGWHYNSDCSAKGDGKTLLILHANTVSTVSWQRWVDHELPPRKGEVTYFDSGLKGLSATNLAAIYLPCYASEAEMKRPYSLTVYAQAPAGMEGSGKETRRTLIDLATDFARQAHEDAKCDLPAKLAG
ncbi:hypothetical protein ACIQKE_18490 [Streptomyces griseoviridis]